MPLPASTAHRAARAQVRLAIHPTLLTAPRVLFHPLTNTASTALSGADVKKFLDAHGVVYEVLSVGE